MVDGLEREREGVFGGRVDAWRAEAAAALAAVDVEPGAVDDEDDVLRQVEDGGDGAHSGE